ncbi:MAG: divalent metal cation transporter [Ancalomicrobiaceae bacterium]|nr:divalent metal cation transporter [Ancalomicrobiaceae bacterium]
MDAFSDDQTAAGRADGRPGRPPISQRFQRSRTAVWIATVGPGLLVMLADTDAGNIVAAADAGARWGYRLLPLPILLIPVLAMVQELAARIGIFSGGGFGDLLRQRTGRLVRTLAGLSLLIATFASLTTELSGITGVGEMFGLSRAFVLPASAGLILAILLSGEYPRVQRLAIFIGLFELGFVAIAWISHPTAKMLFVDLPDQRFGDPGYLYIAAALIGATFNPWMIFYQASAIAELRTGEAGYRAARLDTWIGALVTQLLTAAVLLAAAAAVARGRAPGPLTEIGQISQFLEPVLGPTFGRLVFGLGVIGASLAAAIVASLAAIWGLGELVSGREAFTPGRARGPFALAAAAVVVLSAIAVAATRDLVWLSVGLQVLNALLLPFVAFLLVVMTATALPPDVRLKGVRLWLVVAAITLVAAAGLVGAATMLM